MLDGKRSRLLAAGVAVIALGVIAYLVLRDGGKDEQVLPFGKGEVTVPVEDDDTEQIRTSIVAVIEQAGYSPSVVDCYEDEVNEIPDSAFEEFVSGGLDPSDPEAVKLIRPIQRQLTQACLTKEGTPELTDDNGAVIQEAFAKQVENGYIPDLPRSPLADCVADEIRAMSADEFVALNNASKREITQAYLELGRGCR